VYKSVAEHYSFRMLEGVVGDIMVSV